MQESWNPVRRRCVNCGSPKCGLVMVSKRMSRRRERIEVIAPLGEIISN